MRRLRVLFVVEGYTDIRFVVGLSEICQLSMVVPARQYRESGLGARVKESEAELEVSELPGDRTRYQWGCLVYLWRRTKDFDVILSQEILRGSLNASLVGAIQRKPVITYLNIPPVEYYRCRRERLQCGFVKATVGEGVIRALAWISGKLATRSMAVGPYLSEVASRYSKGVQMAHAYGVDTALYRPVDASEKLRLRGELGLPVDKFLIFLASRISHEKDPETVLRATQLVRSRGVDAVLINLGGGYEQFLSLARTLALPGVKDWVLGRPAAHPMKDLPKYYQAADVLAQASLEEGAGMAPLEALACGTPAVCTAVGGLARILPGHARLTPRGDPDAMAREVLWVANNGEDARAQALRGRNFVCAEWSREKAFEEIRHALNDVVSDGRRSAIGRAIL